MSNEPNLVPYMKYLSPKEQDAMISSLQEAAKLGFGGDWDTKWSKYAHLHRGSLPFVSLSSIKELGEGSDCNCGFCAARNKLRNLGVNV